MKLIVANWKMQLGLRASVDLAVSVKAAAAKSSAQVIVCPSFTALDAVGRRLAKSRIALGAQDVFWQAVGAYTGEISPLHLGELGVEYVLVGHSERRALGETDEQVNKKVITSLHAGLTPIICVGETKPERQAGKTALRVARQVKAALKGLQTRAKERLIFAYEPVWAIGSGNSAAMSDIVRVHEHIRRTAMQSVKGIKFKQIQVLYGGSVDGKNAKDFLLHDQIDGLLVGGASMSRASINSIIAIC